MTKQRSNRLGMYSDVRDILDAALSAGGGAYECETNGQAIHWRQRAYKFRKLYAEVHGLSAESPYDSIVMPRVEGTTVDIIIRRQVGKFKPTLDAPANNQMVEFPDNDDLFDIAANLARSLENEE